MSAVLLFLHITSAFLLSSFLSVPFIIPSLHNRKGEALKASLHTLISLTRTGHIALMGVLLTGAWMVIAYSAFPSPLWVAIALFLLVCVGGLIGMLLKEFKEIVRIERPENQLRERMNYVKVYSWLLDCAILVALFVMTARQLFN
ncbi:hypothetical protein GCM10011391_37610 [Pullulanibacillus camelliae]|uniref:DUF2269 family protein n=1 Tax=Pullulanibacillus camelliae TaxID=1707096 RepID=A0A8J2YMU3_9BACL|nr:hypothetical protein [Pullulanibacillus camelliae]GGE55102.1 hypothetical protein GCM10011391_37610 [Pullulanibacillus camelliae]